METNLITFSDTYKPIAQNISTSNIEASYNQDLSQIPLRELSWFVNQIGTLVFSVSRSYSCLVEIDDQAHAKQLCNNQADGYRFLTLAQKAKQALNEVNNDHLLTMQEPEMGKVYLLGIYVNGKLHESQPVIYTGFSHNLKWYIFNYIGGTDSAGNSCRVLKVGYFPRYQNLSNLQAGTLEQYTPLT